MLYLCLINARLMEDVSLGGCGELPDRCERLILLHNTPNELQLPGFLSYLLKTISPQGINVDRLSTLTL